MNLQQGPLGVTLTLRGRNLHSGLAQLSYIDAQGVPGTFAYPSDSSVQVRENGEFVSSNVILPSSGPAGDWKIVVTDSVGAISSIRYLVLAAPGASTAGVPSLSINPSNGAAGDIIAFTGSNWLPAGTIVNLTLLMGTISLTLLDTPPVSDRNGAISGAFHLPANLNVSQAAVNAVDVASGALHAQVQLLINSSSPTPTASQTVVASPTIESTPVDTATTTPLKTAPLGSDSTHGPLSLLGQEGWGLALLIVGGSLGVAAIMLILFMIPWSERKRNVPRSGHS
ncbi:MAG: hypothetical protein NVSMB27_45140 [Ktedonobacteraceae bacterium]